MFTLSRLTLMYPYRIRVEKLACQYHDREKRRNVEQQPQLWFTGANHSACCVGFSQACYRKPK